MGGFTGPPFCKSRITFLNQMLCPLLAMLCRSNRLFSGLYPLLDRMYSLPSSPYKVKLSKPDVSLAAVKKEIWSNVRIGTTYKSGPSFSWTGSGSNGLPPSLSLGRPFLAMDNTTSVVLLALVLVLVVVTARPGCTTNAVHDANCSQEQRIANIMVAKTHRVLDTMARERAVQ